MSNIYRQLSLHKLIFRFAPAVALPAFLSIFSIYILTRLLDAKALGQYNLVLTLVLVVQSILFFPLDMVLSRFHAITELENRTNALFVTVYKIVIYINVALIFVGGLFFLALGLDRLHASYGDMWVLALPLLFLRTVVSTNQSINRVSGHVTRFSLLECLSPALGLILGLFVIVQFHDDSGAITGLVIGLGITALVDIRIPRRLFLTPSHIDPHIFAEVLRFVWPVMLASVVACTLQYADRFLVDEFNGPAAVAVYIVAFSLVDRPLSMICLVITAGAFQKAMDSYAAEGLESARKQLGYNGAMLLAVAGPACIGLMFSANLIASVMVGPAVRDGLAPLIQVMALTSLLRAMGAHYIDHTFHIPNRPYILLAIYAPAAIGNILLNLIFVPTYGMMAAAHCALISQVLALIAGCIVARYVMPLWLPKKEFLQISACLAVLSVVLAVFHYPEGWAGLLTQASVGAVSYVLAAVSLDLYGLRGFVFRKLNVYFAKLRPVG